MRWLIVIFLFTSGAAQAKPLWCERMLFRMGLGISPVTLRPLDPEDANRVMEIADDLEVSQMVSTESHDGFLEMLEYRIYDRHGDGTGFAIELDGRLVGVLFFTEFHDLARQWPLARNGQWYEVSYLRGPKYWGLGIARQAVHQAIEIGFSNLKAAGLIAFVREDNRRSTAVLESQGFTTLDSREGVHVFVRRRNGQLTF